MWFVSIGLAGAAGWWAGERALRRPSDPLISNSDTTYVVETGTLGRSVRLVATATWPATIAVAPGLTGTVTSVSAPVDGVLTAGARLYSVDLYPVTVAQGLVPSFRELKNGEKGEDVAQLQRQLVTGGYLDSDPDGEFGSATTAAVRAWQRDLGVDDSGVVPKGALVFLPELPARIELPVDVRVGSQLASDSVTVRVLESQPRFVIPLSTNQRQLVPMDGEVRVTNSDGVWVGRIAEAREPTADTIELILEGAEGGEAICSPNCDAVPVGATSNFEAEIIVVPSATGPIVPVAAIETQANGNTGVREAATEQWIPINIVVSDGGLAVVEGLVAGTHIILAHGTSSSPS